MIDVESQIYTPIAVVLRETFPGIDVSGEYVTAPSAFPHVSIVEQDNYPTLEHLSTSDKEQFATLMYEVNVYSNKSTSKKSQCRNMSRIHRLRQHRLGKREEKEWRKEPNMYMNRRQPRSRF